MASDTKSDSLKIEQISIIERNIDDTKLATVIKLMSSTIDNPRALLPSKPWHYVSFILKHASSSFANGIRRALIEELPVKCMHFEEKELDTDDEFILSDVLIKNVNLVPIQQDIELDEFDSCTVFLYKYNDTNDIMDVKASDISIVSKKVGAALDYMDGKKDSDLDYMGGKKDISLDKLIPEGNIILIRLRPGKYVKIKHITFLTGLCKDAAHRFSLLDNVSYDILDVVPYDVFNETGTRSLESNPKEFRISYLTTGNIKPKVVMELCCNTLSSRLEDIKAKIILYSTTDTTKKLYIADGCEIKITEEMAIYKFPGEYITLAYMIAHRCFLLDENILYCIPAVERFDNEVAIIKIQHPDRNKLLIKAIDACIADLLYIKTEITKK